MNRKTSILTAVAVAPAFLLGTPAFAQKKEEKNITCNAEIVEIDTKAKAIVVSIKDGDAKGKERPIEIAGNTKIQKNNKINQKIKDLSTGDLINLTYRKTKELGDDKKTMVEVYKAVQIIVTTSAAGETNAPPAGLKK
jgi:hypothetical protein